MYLETTIYFHIKLLILAAIKCVQMSKAIMKRIQMRGPTQFQISSMAARFLESAFINVLVKCCIYLYISDHYLFGK